MNEELTKAVPIKFSENMIVEVKDHALGKKDRNGEIIKMMKIMVPNAEHRNGYAFPKDENGLSRNDRAAYIYLPAFKVKTDNKNSHMRYAYLKEHPDIPYQIHFNGKEIKQGVYDKPQSLKIKDANEMRSAFGMSEYRKKDISQNLSKQPSIDR